MLRSLTDVLAPIPLSDFLQAFRDKRRLHVRTTDPARAESLLPWHEIEATLSMHAFDEIRATKDGMVLPPQLYKTGEMSAFHDLFAQGASIVLDNIHERLPQIQWLATAIERQLSLVVGVNAYFSFSKGGAFQPHWDRHDVVVIQVHGKKHWKIWDSTFKNPVERSRSARHDITDAPSIELDLSPGDALYIPRGEPHAAAVSGSDSVHLTFGLNSLNGLDVLQNQLNHAAGEDEFLRADLPPLSDERQLRDHEAELKDRLHHLVEALDVSAFLRDHDANRPPVRHTTLASSEAPSDVLRLTLRRRVPLPETTSDEPQPVTIGGASHTLSPAAIDILRRLFASDRQSRGALVEALAARHQQAAVIAGLRELSRLGFLMTERPV